MSGDNDRNLLKAHKKHHSLSKNEFVMTADAVKGIGGGNRQQGAQKLYSMMKKAEAGA